MKLPNDSLGVSDMLDWRECPARMALSMRRHTEGGYPGETDWTNAYGSAVHDAISLVERKGLSNRDAVTQVWPKYAAHLDPEDLALLNDDLDKYRGDTPLGMELVVAEVDAKVPLFVHEGRQIYFRFKLDALYRRKDDHTVFYHRDYKSSKWRKTQAEVDKDPQMWAYNFAICELYPECQSLIQSYEQLRFGNLLTSKNEQQREMMRLWLVETAKAVLGDEDEAPKQNEWCPYCSLVLTCPETTRAARVWRSKLALLAPMTKEGRKTRVALADEGDDLLDVIEELPAMQQAEKHLKAAIEAVRDVIGRMPSEERERLGWRLSERRTTYLPPQALQMLHEALGDSFYEVATVSKTALDQVAGKPERELAESLSLEKVSSTSVTRAR